MVLMKINSNSIMKMKYTKMELANKMKMFYEKINDIYI